MGELQINDNGSKGLSRSVISIIQAVAGTLLVGAIGWIINISFDVRDLQNSQNEIAQLRTDLANRLTAAQRIRDDLVDRFVATNKRIDLMEGVDNGQSSRIDGTDKRVESLIDEASDNRNDIIAIRTRLDYIIAEIDRLRDEQGEVLRKQGYYRQYQGDSSLPAGR
jgi:chromosome segregation ATPase